MQIFRDESGRRAFRTRLFLKIVAASCFALSAATTFMVLKLPVLPQFDRDPFTNDFEGSVSQTLTPIIGQPIARVRTAKSPSQAGLRFAFHDPANEHSFASLQKNGALLDGLFMDWMVIDAKNRTSKKSLKVQKKTIDWIETNAKSIIRLAVIRSEQSPISFSSQHRSAEKLRDYAQKIVKEMTVSQFQGILIDFRFDTMRSSLFASFVTELKKALSTCSCKLAITAPSSPDLAHLADVARKADLFVLATHNFSAGTEKLPTQIAVEEGIKAASRLIAPEKIIVAIGSYAVMASDDGVRTTGSVYQAWSLSRTANAPMHMDADLVGRFRYGNHRSKKVSVSVLDAVTVFNHSRTILAERFAGIALWRLGLEDPTVWQIFGRGKLPEESQIRKLETLLPVDDLSGQIEGKILSVQAVNTQGRRQINFDKSRGVIVGSRLIQAPISYIPSIWDMPASKRVVLTFDDGPDDQNTPLILDILKRKSAKATFFVTGQNALAHPDVLRRIYDEGHDIGNHTFSHPNLAKRSGFEIDVELNATQRVLEKVLGTHTKLFRAPFSSGVDEISADGLRILERASRLGYVTLRITADPYDWAGPPAKTIVERVLSSAAMADQASDIIVLLHDSGGNRKPTIEALPILIDRLQAAGYTFVAAHQLMNMARSKFMPPVTASAEPKPLTMLSRFSVNIYTATAAALPTIAMIVIILALMRSAFVSVFASCHRKIQHERRFLTAHPSICVVIPAYNEEKVIKKTIDSVLSSRYSKLEILVIDDGSSDDTSGVVTRAYDKDEVKLIRVPNAGKASALNTGISHTNADVIVTIDADTILDPNALALLTRHFEDESVGAVAGKAVVGNENSLMAKFQALEYLTSQNLDRRAFERFNAISVVPGALGAWRRTALSDIGGFKEDTLAEDADATISIERANYRVLYEPGAVAYTEVPETVEAFMKQRFRWMFGTLQMAFKHRRALFSKKTPGVGFIALPNILVFQIGFTLIAPLFDIILAVNLASLGIGFWGGESIRNNISILLIYWLVFQAVDVILLAIASHHDGTHAFLRLVPFLFLQRFFYRQLLYIVAVKTLIAALAGTFVGWGKLVRTGTVASTPAYIR